MKLARPGALKLVGLVVLVGAFLGSAVPVTHAYSALCTAPLDTYPVLDLLISVKQSDVLAFPAHAAVGFALERGNCAPTAIQDQWRKAAGHAWTGWSAAVAGAGLARTADATSGGVDILRELQVYAEQEPWHAANLERVENAYIRDTTS